MTLQASNGDEVFQASATVIVHKILTLTSGLELLHSVLL